jgi:hypothetical protein
LNIQVVLRLDNSATEKLTSVVTLKSDVGVQQTNSRNDERVLSTLTPWLEPLLQTIYGRNLQLQKRGHKFATGGCYAYSVNYNRKNVYTFGSWGLYQNFLQL